MKQLQFEYENSESFRREVRRLRQWKDTGICSSMVFDLYIETLEDNLITEIISVIREEIPDALYRGCSTNGNIIEGTLSEKEACVICTMYDYPDTKAEMLQYDLTPETERAVVSALSQEVEKRPWVKAVEMLVDIRGMSMTAFCDDLSKLREDIEIFGGGAFGPEFNEDSACVFSSAGGIRNHSVVFMLLGGKDLHITTTHVTGWKPLGREIRVTRAQGRKIYELDGKPAYETYYKYLNIKNDEHFFSNTLEFPFFYEHNGMSILRAPTSAGEDGSLTMTADVDQGVMARIAYGDPWTILSSVRESAVKVQRIQPQAIHIYSCAARRTFWGEEIGKETRPFQSIAPTSGFYTSGEFLRTNGSVNQHNVTLVVAAFREGELIEGSGNEIEMVDESFSGKVSMINRLATFIEAATEELAEANAQLANMAITDGLTQLYNRMEIQRLITEKLNRHGTDLSLIMIDIDDFKKINDTYGHNEGDNVLKRISLVFRHVIDSTESDGRAGRWGGEEFMIYLAGESSDKADEIAEMVRKEFADIDFENAHHQTISLGVTTAVEGDTTDTLVMRADSALYDAKKTGKNRVVRK